MLKIIITVSANRINSYSLTLNTDDRVLTKLISMPKVSYILLPNRDYADNLNIHQRIERDSCIQHADQIGAKVYSSVDL